MAFTSSSVDKIERGVRQGGQGIYSDMWFVTATIDPSEIAAGAEDNGDLTVPGVQLGDIVLAWSMNKSPGTTSFFDVRVKADDTLMVKITNAHASSALNILEGEWKFVIGRPVW